MATLVLTVVGGVLGGPVGAAVGAALGQQVDAQIFKPKGREGPRLADLKVQASTYGVQIPQMFGTMRVAGSVIWATDLIERKAKSSGGKGRPSVTEYSYSVSLAVALSSRPIGAIRRIWADGNVLRGASGEFQERCVYRWYDGSEDQAVDPLIASAVGMASASAFRGLAYTVFEDLELGSFGNRIPSLTFEVEADASAVDSGTIAGALAHDPERFGGVLQVDGYAASGDRLRDAFAPLVDADAMGLISDPAGWRIAPPTLAGGAVAVADFMADRRILMDRDFIERRRRPLSALPGTIRLRYYEPARDYQLGQQTSVVAGGGAREQRIDLPAVLSATAAHALAMRLAAATGDGRETVRVAGDLAALALPVGAVVATEVGAGVAADWVLSSRSVKGAAVTLEMRRYQPLGTSVAIAAPGEAVTAPDWPLATGMVHLFDIPSLDAEAVSTAQIAIAGAGNNNGWRGADLWFVAAPDTPSEPIGLARPATALGVLAAPLPRGSTALMDKVNTAEVSLANAAMGLESLPVDRLWAGANRAMIGSELIQFGDAEPLGEGRWRLTQLLRGRGGTEAEAGPHATGTPFVMLDDPALVMLSADAALRAASGNSKIEWAARNAMSLTTLAVPDAQIALRPLSPVHGQMLPDGSGGIILRWVRRSRTGLLWRDFVDAGLGESQEMWRISLSPPVSGLGPWDSPTSEWLLSASDIAAVSPGTVAEIRQIGNFAPSLPLMIAMS